MLLRRSSAIDLKIRINRWCNILKIIKEYTNREGYIIRIAVDKSRLRYSICGVRYINKVLTEDDINRTYISYKESSKKKEKVSCLMIDLNNI